MNFMMVTPELAIVDKSQATLLRDLERRRVKAIRLQLWCGRKLGVGFNCVTRDVWRRELESDGN